jgi:hypothetical protein
MVNRSMPSNWRWLDKSETQERFVHVSNVLLTCGLHVNKQYIQGVFNHGTAGTIIVCFHRKQAEVLLKQEQIEVDMSFKRVRQKKINEVLIAGWIDSHDKSKTANPHV